MRFLFILLIFSSVSAQEVLFDGYVYENGNGNPIPYANISFLNSLKGTSSNEKGYFYLDIPESLLENKVHISSLGFRDTIVSAKQIKELGGLRMMEDTYELDEVVVSKNLGDSQILNPINSYGIKSGFTSAATPWVLAMYFPNVGAAKKYLEKVTVFVQKNPKFNRSSKFRLRIYNVDKLTKKPDADLLRKSIVLESDPRMDYVSVDLLDCGIKVPQEGIYIGLEWLFLPYNWYAVGYEDPLTKEKILEDHFAPTFAAVYQKNQNYKTMVYGLGEWSDFSIKSQGNQENLVPAISIKLSKK